MTYKVFVIEIKQPFKEWKPVEVHTRRKSTDLIVYAYRKISRMHNENVSYRVQVYLLNKLPTKQEEK